MTLEELRAIADSVGTRAGWDFSAVRSHRDPVPWNYADIARTYLEPTSRVLDIGTADGERFLSLADHFAQGVAIDIDPEMVARAAARAPKDLLTKVRFEVMDATRLDFPDNAFDVILNRHCSVFASEIVRVLAPGGVFITQQVGDRNTQNVCAVFNCGVAGEHPPQRLGGPAGIEALFKTSGCSTLVLGEYDVPYYFHDVESFVFWLKVLPMPNDFAPEKHLDQVNEIIERYMTPSGIATNDHRLLLVLRKPA